MGVSRITLKTLVGWVRRGRKPARSPEDEAHIYFMLGRVFHAMANYKLVKAIIPGDQLSAYDEVRRTYQTLHATLMGFPRVGLCCGECGSFGHGYMLTNELWKQVADDKDGLLCLPCVQERMDRPLRRDDFVDVPINEPLFAAMELGAGRPPRRPRKDDAES